MGTWSLCTKENTLIIGTDQMKNGEPSQGSYFYTIDFDGNQTVDTEGWILIKYQ